MITDSPDKPHFFENIAVIQILVHYGVSVTLSSGAATTTSGGGHFTFADVEGGTYTITISGYPDDASFDQTTAEVTIAQADQTINRNFNGSWIRTASLTGMVTVEGVGLPGVTVSVAGRQDAQTLTDANGQFTFTGLRAGNYTIEISGFDATDVAFSATSSAVEVAVGESKVWSFEGTYVRESTIAGQVSVEGNGLAGVTISLQGMGADESENTDMGGQFTFSNLRAGEYQLAISGYDTDEYGFSTTSATVRVEHGRTANVPFEGILLRTAAIMGQVSIEGEGLADVTVSLSGEGESQTAMTNEAGQYAFTELPAGNFQVAISGYDTDDYSFETTAKNVALALGETATVPFEGILLRTSGISGRVSVEGTGLDSVTVTLSGDDLEEDMTAMTNATGQYAIAGLAEGDYTVAISGYDDVAYDFDVTSMDVTLGDDDTQIVNFTGTHARTASISGMVYVDEAGKNDSYDDGENALMAPGIALALVGPGILDRTIGATGPDGSFMFGELRAGPYQLVVANAAAAGPDYAYGGPAEGYEFNLGVGDTETQNIPFDITHTTVNFSVNLKRGAAMGAALPGATVSFFSDLAGEQKIGDAMTGDDGMASLRIARSAAANHTVYASVAVPAGSYHTSGAMQAVMWDAQMTTHMASNSADIVNTMASFSFSGATIMTDMGGGNALGGWAISVTSGDDAVDGAPTKLGADGSAKFSETVAAGDLPKSYKVEMAGWKDQSNDTLTGDGGERYTSTSVMHTHDGLSLAGTSTDAGMLEVTYTTQRLRVYVHQENDQVMGYTGNVLGGDERMGGIIDVDIEHIAANGRSNSFEPEDSVKSSARGGVYQFWNVPAAANVIVTADEVPTLGKDKDDNDIPNTNRLLKKNGHSDELSAYNDVEANGIMGGAFGAQGGFHHTVDLCPLMSDAGDQRHGECSSFAFVETFPVDGQAWKNVVGKLDDDFRTTWSKAGVKGLTVSMDPVDGENLAGDQESFTDEKGTKLKFDFGHMASGVYTVTVPRHWRKLRGPLESPTNDLAASITPLDSALNIDVTPATGYAYGAVTDSENRRMAGVTVNVNGVSVETDSNGRYIAEGFYARNYRAPGSRVTQRNRIVVTTAEEGSEETTNLGSFAANTPRRIDVKIADAAEVTTISGRVTHSDGGAGVGGVRVWVDGRAPLNPNARSSSRLTRNNIYITNSNGDYTVRIKAKDGGASAAVTVSKDGMFFSPDQHTVSAVADANISGINFTAFDNGTIHGRVVDARNNPISGVIVTAMQVSPGTATDADTTGTTGTYSLSVRYGQYSVSAAKAGYTFTDTTGVNVPNDGKAINDLIGTAVANYAQLSSLSLSGVTRLCRTTACPASARGFRSAHTAYTATVANSLAMTTVSATAGGGAKVTEIYPDDADATATGHQIALAAGETTDIEIEVVAGDNSDTTTYEVAVYRQTESTSISGTIMDAQNDEDGNPVAISGVRVTVSEGLIGGSTDAKTGDRYVTTNRSGAYEANVESGTGGVTLTPSKDGYSFEPENRTVQRNAGSVSGIDFTGSAYATITGTVVDNNGAALEGATVTATSEGVSASDDSDRRGRFSVSVPAGTATITAAKDGYQFGSQTVNVAAGESRAVGEIMGSPSTDASLSSVTVNDSTLTATNGSYSIEVANDVMMATIVATPTDGGAEVAYSGTDDADTVMAGHQVALSVGDNETTVTVTAAAGNTESYTVTVTRGSSMDATLSALSLSDGTLDPAFASDVDAYTASVGNEVATVTVTATANDADATVEIMPADADDATDGHQVNLAVGETPITATVTASDGSATEAYTVTVTRAAAVVTLSANPNPVAEGGMATITGTVDVGQAEEFTVTVSATGDGLDSLSTNATLTFAAEATTSTGVVTVAAADNDTVDTSGLTVVVKGASSVTTMMLDSLVLAVTDDEMVASAPRNLDVTTVGDGTATVSWDSPSQIGTAAITSYEWELSAPGVATTSNSVTDLANLSVDLTGLQNGLDYTFSVFARSSLGDGEAASITVKSQPDLTMAVTPTTITEAGTDSAEVIVTLSNTTREAVTVTVAVDSTHLASVRNAVMVIEAGTTADTAYVKADQNLVDADNTLMVTASADNANDPAAGETITITDDDEAPGAPRNLTITVGDRELTLEWISPTSAGTSAITHYEYRYSSAALDDDDEWTTAASPVTITGLTNGTTYNIEVRAVSAAGPGVAASDTGTPSTE